MRAMVPGRLGEGGRGEGGWSGFARPLAACCARVVLRACAVGGEAAMRRAGCLWGAGGERRAQGRPGVGRPASWPCVAAPMVHALAGRAARVRGFWGNGSLGALSQKGVRASLSPPGSAPHVPLPLP